MARSAADYGNMREFLHELIPVRLTPRAEQRARTSQEQLMHAGQHRAVSVADIQRLMSREFGKEHD